MTKPTIEELQAELQEVVNKHNQANAVMVQCKNRFAEIQAILSYVGESEIPATEAVTDQPTTTES